MIRSEAIRFIIVRSLGNFLLLLGLYGVGATLGPALYFELQYRIAEARGIKFAAAKDFRRCNSPQDGKQKDACMIIPTGLPHASDSIGIARSGKTNVSFLDVLAGAKEQVLIPIDTDFGVLIPKIGVNVKVSPNIDPVNKDIFLPVLQEGIAHAKGTVFPGMPGNIYLFAHSTDSWWNAGRYNAVFYLLKDMMSGDEVIVFFEGVRYDYVVTEKFVTDSTYVDLLSGEQAGPQRLILQTCWPPGTSWKRLYVLAKPRVSI